MAQPLACQHCMQRPLTRHEAKQFSTCQGADTVAKELWNPHRPFAQAAAGNNIEKHRRSRRFGVCRAKLQSCSDTFTASSCLPQVLFSQISAGYGDRPKRLLHVFSCRSSECSRGLSKSRHQNFSLLLHLPPDLWQVTSASAQSAPEAVTQSRGAC